MLTRRPPAPFEYLKLKQGKKGLTATIQTHKKNVSEDVLEKRRIEARLIARMEAKKAAEETKQQKRAKGMNRAYGKLNPTQATTIRELAVEQNNLLGRLSGEYNAGKKLSKPELNQTKKDLTSIISRITEQINKSAANIKTLNASEGKTNKEYLLHLIGARSKIIRKLSDYEETQFFPKGFVAEIKAQSGMKPSK
jgi:hypothetical protein